MHKYVILSLKHSEGNQATFWRADDAGYTIYPWSAGIYTHEQVSAKPNYYNDGINTLAIPLTSGGMEAIGMKTTFDVARVEAIKKSKSKRKELIHG